MLTAFHLVDGRLRTGMSAPEAAAALGGSSGFLWLDLEAPGQAELALLREAARQHPLAAADCVASSKVPKLNAYGNLVHMVIHGSSPPSADGGLQTRELDALWGERFLLTWHAHPLRSVAAVRGRCLQEPQAILGQGPARALHHILDALVDNWFPFVDAASQRLAALERRIAESPGQGVLEGLLVFNRQVVQRLRIVDAQREVFDRMSREEIPFVGPEARAYFRCLYDRAVILHGHLELHREQVHAARETCLLMVSNDLNRVMKTLTVVSTVLMSMTVVTGIYGMNFTHMPGLDRAWGYPAALALMLASGVGMYWWVRRKGWL